MTKYSAITPLSTPVGLPTLASLLVDTLIRLGVTNFFVAPGSRSAPLTTALAARSDAITCVIYDERSAAYVALGFAQQTGRPAALICTSGTAAVNFGPAVVEAYYQGVPLIVLTADRPPEWIDQQDNQAIRQPGLYGAHVRATYSFPRDDGHPDTRWHAIRIVSDAVQVASGGLPGPVHINVPLREPLYLAEDPPALLRLSNVARAAATVGTLADGEWLEILRIWNNAERKLIVGGLHPPDSRLNAALASLSCDPSVVVVGDITANLPAANGHLSRWDVALATTDPEALAALRPDLVVVYGGPITSRYLTSLLRSQPPSALWRVCPALPAPDTFQALTLAVPLQPHDFFEALVERLGDHATSANGYANSWAAATACAHAALEDLLDHAPWSEFVALRAIMAHLPPASSLQVGNSMPIRYVNFLGPCPGHEPARFDANRGTSGIDGTVSTAVGAALATRALTSLVVGDLGFFYDRNGLWHHHLPDNLRIVVLNNHGGGIFDIIEGPDSLPAEIRNRYFLTPHTLTARRTAEDHGLDYQHVADLASLRAALPDFFAPHDRPAILEIASDMATNSALFRAFRARMRTLRLAD